MVLRPEANGCASLATERRPLPRPPIFGYVSAAPMREIWPGAPYPLGATYDGAGTNFSLFSEVAARVDLCLFDDAGKETRLRLPEVNAHCFHGYVPGVGPGQRYGFRVFGPHAPSVGHRCNPNKLLIDPCARAITGPVRWHPAVYDYPRLGHPVDTSQHDSAPFVPRSVVVSSEFDWGADHPPGTPLQESVIYEMHVRGFTKLHPDIPPELRGTYAGLAHPAAIEHLKRLGVTAVELMPVHEFIHREHLVDDGLSNYWGYDSIGYFAPHHGYASTGTRGEQVREFKEMVKALHAAGIEVYLDVVYNHTGEGDHRGPTLCFRGIDNASYYRLYAGDRRYYEDFTGTGNSLNMRSPFVLQLIMDSLRYWIGEMRVDGFRFDLASALARELHAVDRLASFFDLIQQDPIVRRAKLIAEPWDVGDGGYQVGNFPPLWSEWNGEYRDTIRDLWRGADHSLPDFARRFTGSADLYESTGRRPHASINFVTAHDGFPLRDLVSYNEKHNLANKENNRDGESHNRSWNCGVEGATDDPHVLELRARQQRNLLATLFLSQGVPMLLAGDELGRTQRGNNNAYNQDGPISWVDWQKVDDRLLEFCRQLVNFTRSHPVFRRRRWFRGQIVRGSALPDIGWYTPSGEAMTDADWDVGYAKSLGVFLNGSAPLGRDRYGRVLQDESFFVLMNAWGDAMPFRLPARLAQHRWELVFDTALIGREFWSIPALTDRPIDVGGHSVQLLRCLDRLPGPPVDAEATEDLY